jgi:hypothetical protein
MPDNTPTTHDENAASWRDLADQLTPEQIARLEESERSYRSDAVSLPMSWTWVPRTEGDIARTLLGFARADVADNLNEVLFADIALPADRDHGGDLRGRPDRVRNGRAADHSAPGPRTTEAVGACAYVGAATGRTCMSPLDPRPGWVRDRTYELHDSGLRWIDAREQANAEADEKFGTGEDADKS